LNADFPIIGIGATESREDDGTGSEDGEKRLHFFFLGNRLSNRSDNAKATVAMGINDPTPAVSGKVGRRIECYRFFLRPPFLPPLRELALLDFFPRPPPLFLPPLSDLFTVAQARRSASFFDVPRFS